MSDRQTTEQNLQEHLRQLAYPRHATANREGHEKASQYVLQTLSSFGFSVKPHEFSWNGSSYRNWIASETADSAPPVLIISAHFDTVPDCRGADDNASGVAVLLEAAREYALGAR